MLLASSEMTGSRGKETKYRYRILDLLHKLAGADYSRHYNDMLDLLEQNGFRKKTIAEKLRGKAQNAATLGDFKKELGYAELYLISMFLNSLRVIHADLPQRDAKSRNTLAKALSIQDLFSPGQFEPKI